MSAGWARIIPKERDDPNDPAGGSSSSTIKVTFSAACESCIIFSLIRLRDPGPLILTYEECEALI